MTSVEFNGDAVQVDAAILAEGLGMALSTFRTEMQAGRITGVVERGTDTDLGRHRITFFSTHRRFRLIVDQHGHHPSLSVPGVGGDVVKNDTRCFACLG